MCLCTVLENLCILHHQLLDISHTLPTLPNIRNHKCLLLRMLVVLLQVDLSQVVVLQAVVLLAVVTFVLTNYGVLFPD